MTAGVPKLPLVAHNQRPEVDRAADSLLVQGLYRSEPFASQEGQSVMIVTQLESTGARWLFPCFDHPSVKVEHVTRQQNAPGCIWPEQTFCSDERQGLLAAHSDPTTSWRALARAGSSAVLLTPPSR